MDPLPGPAVEPALDLRLQPSPTEERERIAAALGGDPAARSWIVRQYAPSVFRFCRRMLDDEQDARDAAQDTLVKALSNLHRYDTAWRFPAWLFGIARNTCIDEHRRRRRRPAVEAVDLPDPQAGPGELLEREREGARVRAALEALPPPYREVLLLYHYENLKYREIAEVLGVPLGTVMNRIFRARQRMQAALLDDPAPEVRT